MNNSLNILTAYIKRHGNPYNINVSCQKLKNFATQVMVDPVVAEPLLNFFPNAKQIIDEYHRQVYIAKTSLLHGKIKKLKLPKFNAIVQIDLREQNIQKQKERDAQFALSFYLIAGEKSCTMKDVLSYDLTPSSIYDGSCMTKTTQKS